MRTKKESSTESKKERERDKEILVLIDLWKELAQVTEWRLEAAHGCAVRFCFFFFFSFKRHIYVKT